jgi:GT2 family glycosyltransferase
LTYQSILYNVPTPLVERKLIWLANAIDVATKNRDISFTVLFGDSSPVQLISDDIWLSWKNHFKSSFNLEYEFFGANLGHGGGHNQLSLKSEADYIVFANPDVLVLPDVFELCISDFEENEELAAVDARQLPFEHPKDYDKITGETSWCSGAFLFVRGYAFREVKGFDEKTFFMHGDDVDLSWRLKLEGFKIKHKPDAVVFHSKLLESGNRISGSNAELKYSALSALLLPWKWSRDDILTEIETAMAGSFDSNHTEAIADFSRLKAADLLPNRIDPENNIAIFINGNYAPHRW